MTDILILRKRYRTQHEYMLSNRKDITKSTRRQRNFRPRGKVYIRLIMREVEKQEIDKRRKAFCRVPGVYNNLLIGENKNLRINKHNK